MAESLPNDNVRKNVVWRRRLGGMLCAPLVMAGCSSGEEVTRQEAETQALEQYEDAFTSASAAGKYILQYLRANEVYLIKYPDAELLAGADTAEWHTVKINNGCLNSTAYDIAGGSVEGSIGGLFSSGSVEGDTPSAAAFAEINPDNDDQLVVQSGHNNSVDLVFDGLESDAALTPNDERTENILRTYGCETGVIDAE